MGIEDDFKYLLRNLNKKERGGNNIYNLAKSSGTSQSALSDYINEKDINNKKKGLSFSTVAKVLDYLGYSLACKDASVVSFINPSTGTSPLVLSPNNVSVNVYSVAGAGPAWDYSDEEPFCTIPVPENLAFKATFAFLVKGDSMYPTIKDDAVVGIKTDEPFISNEIYAIRIPYEGVSIKRVLVDVENEKYVIKSDNPDKTKFADINIPIAVAPDLIIGKVVWIWQKC